MKRISYILVILVLIGCSKEASNTNLNGQVFGTTYSIIYNAETDFAPQIDSLFNDINKSLSTYIPNSDISKLNRNEAVEVDAYFEDVFNASQRVYAETKGAFDPTIGAVVNAWDFGPEGKIVGLDCPGYSWIP